MRHPEAISQKQLVAWFRLQYPQYEDLLAVFANGENVGPRRMAELKRLGLVPGQPDLLLSIARQGRNGLYIEMKAPKGRLRENQIRIHEKLRDQNFKVVVPHGFIEARDEIDNYLGTML